MIQFYTETKRETIADCAYLCGDLLLWAEGDTFRERCAWISQFCVWLHCFDDEECVGYLALHPHGERYLLHYGWVDHAGISAFRMGMHVADRICLENGKTLGAYIDDESSAAFRVAKAFGFKPTNEKHFYEFKQEATTT